jgi:hypothetical protein
MMTLWKLKGLITSDEMLYSFAPQGPIGGAPPEGRSIQIRKATVNDRTKTKRAEIIYRSAAEDNSLTRKIRGLVRADIIFTYRNEEFITNASLRQLAVHIDEERYSYGYEND